jgi:hypothetical protein
LLVSVSVLVGFGKDLVKRRNLRVKEKSERRKNSKGARKRKRIQVRVCINVI